jgi:hypothetical protein
MTASAMEPMRSIPPHLQAIAGPNEARHSAVSWAAVAAGAFVTAALGLILLALGAGAGLSSLSPWSTSGLTTASVGKVALLWIAGIEVVASSVGGYMAGRLRTKWVDVHSHEVYFRDTAHGFLSWSVALVLTAAFLTSAATAMVGGETRSTASARSEQSADGVERYYVDQLYRADPAVPLSGASADAATRAEAGMILAHSIRQREISAADKSYLDANVAAKTGITTANADARVTDVFAQAQQAVNSARRAGAHALYWLFVALLLGAFSASAAATFGGKERDKAHLTTPLL